MAAMISTRSHFPLRIGGLAAELGINPKTIRYYEEIGLLAAPARSPAGYRLYSAADGERLRFIAKAKAIADWKEAEAEKRLGAKAADVEKRLKDGAPFDTLAAELGLEKQIKRGLKRDSDDADFGRAGVAAIFGLAEGGSGLVAAPTGDAQIVFKVTEVFEPAGADANSIPEDAQKSFASGMVDDLLDQLVAKLQGEYGATVNRAAIDQALAF